jgi:beta-galactosidase
MKKVRHFIQMEWGGESHAGRHAEDPDRCLVKAITGQYKDQTEYEYLLSCGQDRASENGDWSESYLCNLLDWHLKEQETMTWLTGSAQWIFKDFATPLRSQNPIPHVNEKGLAQRDLTLKESYFVFQSYWSEKPMIHIYGHSWPIRWGDEEEQKLVKVYSNCAQAELFLNNVSCGVRKRNSQDFPAAGLHWLMKFKSGYNHLRAVGQKNGMTVVDELHFQYQTEKWQRPARLDLKETARSNGITIIEAKIYDSNDVPCLDARKQVRFRSNGDGTLLDNTGTVTGSRVVELCNGRAEISLKTNNGTSSVSVSCDGLPSMLLTVV